MALLGKHADQTSFSVSLWKGPEGSAPWIWWWKEVPALLTERIANKRKTIVWKIKGDGSQTWGSGSPIHILLGREERNKAMWMDTTDIPEAAQAKLIKAYYFH